MSQDNDRYTIEETEAQLREHNPGLRHLRSASRRTVVRGAPGWPELVITSCRLAATGLSAVIHRALARVQPRRSIPPALPK